MSYVRTEWQNDTLPAINETNLNHIEDGIYDAHNAIASLNTFLEPTPLTFTITPSVGIVEAATGWRCGNVVYVRIAVKNGTSVASGSNIFEGTASTGLPRPLAFTVNGSYYGNHSIGGSLGTTGNIIVRNSSATAVTVGEGANAVNITFTYITND